MADCNHNCDSCNVEGCASRKIEKVKTNELTNVKHCFAIMSGKGGVGKSLVTSLIASAMNKKGKSVAIIDADVTGPSIPQTFGLKGKYASGDEQYLYPVLSKQGIKIMSANLLMEDEQLGMGIFRIEISVISLSLFVKITEIELASFL